MSRRDRWKSANEMGIDTWRHARRLGRTAAERIALFNVAMERRERHGARALRANAKRRGLSSKATTSPRPNCYPWCFFIWTRNGPAPVLLSSVGTAASTPALSMRGQRHLIDGKMGSAIVISEPAVMKMPALPALSGAQAGQVRT